MSKRPINLKRAARARKAIERSRLPAFVRPERWLMSRGYASTVGEARKIIRDERLRIDSHKVGFADVQVEAADGTLRESRIIEDIPADDAKRLTVVAA